MLGEVAPLLVPQFDAALISLGILCALLFCLGLLAVSDAFVRALFGTVSGAVGWIPWAGKIITSPVHKIEQKIHDLIGQAEQAIDAQVGRWFGSLAKLVEWVGQEIRRHAGLLSIMATILLGPAITAVLRDAIKLVSREIRHARAQVTGLLHYVHVTLPAEIAQAEKAAERRAKALAGTIGHVVEHDIPSLRDAVRGLLDRLDHLAKRLRAAEKRITLAALAAAVIATLAKVGAGWIRCGPWNRIGKAGCKLPYHWVTDLLALVTDYLVLTNVCTAITWLEDGYAVVEPELTALITDATKGICHGTSLIGLELTVPPLQLPTAAEIEPVGLEV